MVNQLKWCLYVSYFFGRATGLLNFEFDFKTGRIKFTKRATIWAACMHILIFIATIYHRINEDFWTRNRAIVLRENVYLVIEYIRIIGALLALVSRWTQRGTFKRLYNSFRRLYQQNPEIILYCQRSIVWKCFCIKTAEILQAIVTIYLVRNHLTFSLCIRSWCNFSLVVIINGITTQYFVAMAGIRGQYILLNKDLKAIVAETRSLNPKRRGVFVTKCCCLADRLEKIAQSQSELQGLTEWILRTYQVQIACMVIVFYLNLVGNCYIIFSYTKNSASPYAWPKSAAIILTTLTVFYFIDCWVNLFNVFHLLDAHEEMVQLLGERTLFHSALDPRLEAVIDRFTLNLARNPLKLRNLGLFEINKFSSFALLNSFVTHIILLIQYDIENY